MKILVLYADDSNYGDNREISIGENVILKLVIDRWFFFVKWKLLQIILSTFIISIVDEVN